MVSSFQNGIQYWAGQLLWDWLSIASLRIWKGVSATVSATVQGLSFIQQTCDTAGRMSSTTVAQPKINACLSIKKKYARVQNYVKAL